MGQTLFLEKPWCYLTVLIGYSVPVKWHTEPPSSYPAHKMLDGERSIGEKILAPAPFLALLRDPLELFAFLFTSLEPQPGFYEGAAAGGSVCVPRGGKAARVTEHVSRHLLTALTKASSPQRNLSSIQIVGCQLGSASQIQPLCLTCRETSGHHSPRCTLCLPRWWLRSWHRRARWR